MKRKIDRAPIRFERQQGEATLDVREMGSAYVDLFAEKARPV